jgi:propionyl-CoA carboxylase alpha chain
MGAPTPPAADWVVIVDRQATPLSVQLQEGGAAVTLADGAVVQLQSGWRPGQSVLTGTLDGAPFALRVKPTNGGYVIRNRGVTQTLIVCSPRIAELQAKLPAKQAADTSRQVLSPMPGLVVSLEVAEGQEVKTGEAVAIVEAMKMQNIIRAERDGVVAKIHVAPGASVAADEVMVELA